MKQRCKKRSIIMLALIGYLLVCASCGYIVGEPETTTVQSGSDTTTVGTEDDGIMQDYGELVLMKSSDEAPRVKSYSPNEENFITYEYIYMDTGDASDEFPEIYVYLNDSAEPIDKTNYSTSAFYERRFLSFWLDDDNILLDATRIYNIDSNEISVISPPNDEIGEYLSSRKGEYAPNSSGKKIAYMALVEKDYGQQGQQLYIYDRDDEEWEMLCETLSDDWYSIWGFGLLFSNDNIYFNSITNEARQLMRYSLKDRALSSICNDSVIEKISPDQAYCCLSDGSTEVILDVNREDPIFELQVESLSHICWADMEERAAYIQEGNLTVYDFKNRRVIFDIDISGIESNGQYIKELYFVDGALYVETIEQETSINRIYMLKMGGE